MNNEYLDRINLRAIKREQRRQAMCEYLVAIFTVGFAVLLIWAVFATKHIKDY